MRLVSFDSIIQRARQRCNAVGSQNPPDSYIMGYVADEFVEMYVKVMDASASDYWYEYYTFATQAGVNLYPLPIDQDRLRRVDSQPTGSPATQWNTVKRFSEAMQNSNGSPWGSTMPVGQTIRLAYAPDPPVPQQYATLTLLSANGIDGIVFTALQAGVAGANVSVQIATPSGGACVISVGSTPYKVIITPASGGSSIQAVLAALTASALSSAVLSAAALNNIQSDIFTATVAATNLGGVLNYNMPEGFDRMLVAGSAALICSSLNRDGSAFTAERNEQAALITVRSDKRDENWPEVAQDVQREMRMRNNPFYQAGPMTFGYREAGQQIMLLPWVE
jgi:hypothetical protein